MPNPYLVAALGLNLGGKLFGVGSERKRRQKLRQQLLAENAPLEALLRTRQFGPSESEGNIMNAVTQGTLSDLASRGVLNSSISAPAVAQAVAPIENQRQQRTQGLLERVVAARQAIIQGTELPGYGQAFGDAFGEGGNLLALFAGMQQRRAGGDDLGVQGGAAGEYMSSDRQFSDPFNEAQRDPFYGILR